MAGSLSSVAVQTGKWEETMHMPTSCPVLRVFSQALETPGDCTEQELLHHIFSSFLGLLGSLSAARIEREAEFLLHYCPSYTYITFQKRVPRDLHTSI